MTTYTVFKGRIKTDLDVFTALISNTLVACAGLHREIDPQLFKVALATHMVQYHPWTAADFWRLEFEWSADTVVFEGHAKINPKGTPNVYKVILNSRYKLDPTKLLELTENTIVEDEIDFGKVSNNLKELSDGVASKYSPEEQETIIENLRNKYGPNIGHDQMTMVIDPDNSDDLEKVADGVASKYGSEAAALMLKTLNERQQNKQLIMESDDLAVSKFLEKVKRNSVTGIPDNNLSGSYSPQYEPVVIGEPVDLTAHLIEDIVDKHVDVLNDVAVIGSGTMGTIAHVSARTGGKRAAIQALISTLDMNGDTHMPVRGYVQIHSKDQFDKYKPRDLPTGFELLLIEDGPDATPSSYVPDGEDWKFRGHVTPEQLAALQQNGPVLMPEMKMQLTAPRGYHETSPYVETSIVGPGKHGRRGKSKRGNRKDRWS